MWYNPRCSAAKDSRRPSVGIHVIASVGRGPRTWAKAAALAEWWSVRNAVLRPMPSWPVALRPVAAAPELRSMFFPVPMQRPVQYIGRQIEVGDPSDLDGRPGKAGFVAVAKTSVEAPRDQGLASVVLNENCHGVVNSLLASSSVPSGASSLIPCASQGPSANLDSSASLLQSRTPYATVGNPVSRGLARLTPLWCKTIAVPYVLRPHE
jgi:hypothetical protein